MILQIKSIFLSGYQIDSLFILGLHIIIMSHVIQINC